MRFATIAARVAVLTMAGGGAVLGVTAGPATGTVDKYKCPEVVHTSTADVTITAGGKATIDPDGGMIFETAVNADAVNWKKTLSPHVPMAAVARMSYQTRKFPVEGGNVAALPAYRIYLTGTDGPSSSTTLVYEPYYQDGVGNPAVNVTRTWDVKAGKFWATQTIAGIVAEPGGSYAGNKTWAQIRAANPHAKVTGFAVGQGTYNHGTKARVNHVIFDGLRKCADHVWCKPEATPTSTPTPTPTVTGTAVGGGGNGGGKPGLPVTGPVAAGAGAVGVVLLVAGAAFMLLTRRRRVRFTAT
jgi:hypothetical protein